LTGLDAAVSLAGFCVVYLVMFSAGLALMIRIIRLGPAEQATEPELIESGRPAAPVQALPSTEAGQHP